MAQTAKTQTLAQWCAEKRREVERLCNEAEERFACAALHLAECERILAEVR